MKRRSAFVPQATYIALNHGSVWMDHPWVSGALIFGDTSQEQWLGAK
jgi:hypothetical protein